MSAGQDQDRTEHATPFKVSEARKRGQVAKSHDLGVLAVLLVIGGSLFSLAPGIIQVLAVRLADGLRASAKPVHQASHAAALIGDELLGALGIIAPLLLALVVAVVAVQLLQTGGVLSTTPLKPDWTRLNPAKGLKRLFSWRLLYEAVKSCLKLLTMLAVAFVVLHLSLAGAVHLQGASTRMLMSAVLDAAGGLTMKIAAALALFALVDHLYVRWDYLRSLRMSRREVLDELKHRDGDPRLRARLRELRHAHLRRARAMATVPKADVLITNPSHLAVALRYHHGESPAPQVLAKGAGRLARHMRDVAYRARVPIVHSPVLARALFSEVEQEAYVPERWYPQVARILVWVQACRNARGPGKP